MRQYLFFLIAISFLTVSNAQNCFDFDSSKEFDFNTIVTYKDEQKLGKADILIQIIDRKNGVKVQTILIESEFILKSKNFRFCENNKSYPSDTFLESKENDFGDLIVVDLNFDGKEDIAIKREEGGNGGPIFNFYIQSKNKQFILDKYLSNEMLYFPDYIDSKEKTLHVYLRIDSLSEEGITYSFSDVSKTWSILKKLKYRN